jgi:hypothetical protein
MIDVLEYDVVLVLLRTKRSKHNYVLIPFFINVDALHCTVQYIQFPLLFDIFCLLKYSVKDIAICNPPQTPLLSDPKCCARQ